MSLTNDMLNNLAKRHSLNTDSEFLFNGLEATASNKMYYLTYAVYIFALLIILSVPVWVYDFTVHYLKSDSVQPALQVIQVQPMHFSVHPKIMLKNNQTVPVKIAVQEPIQNQVMQLYQDALSLIAQNQTSAAIEKLQNIIQAVPGFQDARVTLATLYLENNDVVNAAQLLTDGLAISPSNLPLTLLFARTLIMQGHNHEALLALDNIADAAGNNNTYIDLLAFVQESLGHYSDAISLYQALLHNDPTNIRWWVSLGIAQDRTGHKNAALKAYNKANAIGQLPPDLQSYVTRRIHDLGD